MNRRRKLQPLKSPMQERSRQTVAAILQAATYILVEDGYDALTTNRIADRAGVNIATLYQYFPNKEAIFAELVRRHVAETRAATLRALATHRGTGLEARVRASVEATIAAHRIEPQLHRIFTEEAPRLGMDPVEAPADEPLRREQERWRDEAVSTLPDPDLAIWIARTAVHSLVHRAIVERPQDFARPVFAAEVTRLICRYLGRRSARASGR